MGIVQIAFLSLIAVLGVSLLSTRLFNHPQTPYVTATAAITLCTIILGNMKGTFGDFAVATSSILLSSTTLYLLMNPALIASQTLSVQGGQTSSQTPLKRIGKGEVLK